MAITHRDTGLALICSVALGCSSAWGQQATPGYRVQGTLNATAYATTNGSATAGTQGKSDLITTVSPGIDVQARGANSELVGQWQFNLIQSARNTQPDGVQPTGRMRLHTEPMRQGWGLDASVLSTQVRSSALSTASGGPNTADTYNNTLYTLSPFIDKALDDTRRVEARLQRSLLHISQSNAALQDRPETRQSDDLLRFTQRPTPFGYALEWRQQRSSVSDASSPSLDERRAKALLTYAPWPELTVGASIGKSHNNVAGQIVRDTSRGATLNWKPTERTLLDTELEHRYYGSSWRVAIGHRMPWLAFGLQSERVASTYVSQLGTLGASGNLRGLYDALLTTRIPDPVERAKAVDSLVTNRNLATQAQTGGDVYNVAAQLRQATTGRLAFMGRRDILTFVGGQSRTAPLQDTSGGDTTLLSNIARTKAYFFDVQLNHQLTPFTSVSGGLLWNRTWSIAPATDLATLSRDFTMRTSVNTLLSRDTSATLGLKRQLTHNPSTTSSDESAMYLGLGYRF
jgi:uncharacterized protein (PEP-CTERM system associated)